jgi:hypothetical protein
VANLGSRGKSLLALMFITFLYLPANLQALPQVKYLVTTNPSKLQFGNVQVGNTANLYETITNVGHVNISGTSASIAGTGFSYSGLTFPLTLAPGHSITFTATFTPPSSGNFTGTLTLYSDKGSLSIPLTGTGIAAGTLSVSPASMNFGSVNVGQSGQQNALMVASGGAVTVTAASISNAEFSISGISFPLTLQAGQSQPFTVTFAPQQSGVASGTLSFANSPNSPVVVALTGTGNNPPPPPSVTLTWDGSGSPVSGYNVFRGNVSGGPYAQINSALDPNTLYEDNNVTSGKTYYYVTTAVNSSGEQSTYSNEVQAIIP